MKLGTDSKGRLYIKDLKMVNVSSGTEAYQVFMSGQHNLKIAATALNTRSSRSHCIFTVKLLKYHNGDDAENVQVSTLVSVFIFDFISHLITCRIITSNY